MRNSICSTLRWMVEVLNKLVEKIDTGVPIGFMEIEDEDNSKVTDENVWIAVIMRKNKTKNYVMVGSYPAVARHLIKINAKPYQTSLHSLKQYREIAQAQVMSEIK